MSIMSALRRILNDTPGTATNIDYNFQVLEDYVNTSVVTTENPPAITGPLVVGAPVVDNHAATKGYVDSQWFPGMLTDFAGATLPAAMVDEWEICAGQTRSTADPKYAALFAVIQYLYGGSGGTFAFPNFQGRTSVGFQTGEAAFSPLGKTGGQRNSELLQHSHQIPAHNHTASSNTVDINHDHDFSGTTGSDGTHGHNFGNGSAIWYNGGGGFGGLTPDVGNMNTATFLHDGAHTHTFSGRTLGMRGGVNQSHSHTITVNDRAPFNTDNAGAGTGLVDKNLQPYVAVNKIIKL